MLESTVEFFRRPTCNGHLTELKVRREQGQTDVWNSAGGTLIPLQVFSAGVQGERS